MSEKKKIYKTDSKSKESSESSFEFEKLNIQKTEEPNLEPKSRVNIVTILILRLKY
jgi:hypothetical protein